MATTTAAKNLLNRFLRLFNLRLETLTAERKERRRLEALERAGHFERQVFDLAPAFARIPAHEMLDEIARYGERFDEFAALPRSATDYTFRNDYFSSPDAEVLYAVVRKYRPATVLEIGSGNSTKLIRRASRDGEFATRIVSVDPHPRAEIDRLVDEVHRQPVETLASFPVLRSGDMVFIDSSHLLRPGSDVVYLYLHFLPRLAPGVLIHIHDIFLPYEYPRDWVLEKHWDGNEQYLLQQPLMADREYDVLWAGYYLQRTLPDFARYFHHLNGRVASSLWLRRR